MKSSIIWMATLGALLTAGCGGLHVDRISLDDPRLPVDARQWVADAEDAVVVSGARLAEARQTVRDMVKRQQQTIASTPLTGAQGTPAQMKREQLGLARMDTAKAGFELAQAELNLSKARLQLVYAETAMRHDIDVYNMPPLQAAVDTALKSVVRWRSLHRKARSAELRATDEWWTSWQTLVRVKDSDTRPFWSVGE